MSERAYGIVRDIEEDYGVVIEEYPTDILCHGTHCNHPECDCWDTLRFELKRIAEQQVAEREKESRSMKSLYDVESRIERNFAEDVADGICQPHSYF